MAENQAAKKKVMVAMDGSQCSDHAYQWYLRHFREPNDYVIFVHCPEMPHSQVSSFFTMSSDDIQGMLVEQAKTTKLLLARLKEHLKREQMEGKVVCKDGDPKDTLLKVSKDEDVDCIITGGHGQNRNFLDRLGSVSSYLVHHAKVPVVLVKRKKTVTTDQNMSA